VAGVTERPVTQTFTRGRLNPRGLKETQSSLVRREIASFDAGFPLVLLWTDEYTFFMNNKKKYIAPLLVACVVSSIPATAEAKLKPTGIIGQTVADGGMSVQVRKVQCGLTKIGSGYFVEKALGQFCVITFAMTPSKKKPVSYFSSAQKAVTKAGFEVESKSIMSDEFQPFLDVNPGNSVLLKIAFDVGAKDPIVIAEFHDSIFSGGVQIDLTKGSYKK
jgi:hypothetical protein